MKANKAQKIENGNSVSSLNSLRNIDDLHPTNLKNTIILYTDDIRVKYGKIEPSPNAPVNKIEYIKAFREHPRFHELSDRLLNVFLDALSINKQHLDVPTFKEFVDDIFVRLDKGKISHGDAVGIVAAQSLSEQMTQATLNSFHFSGTKKSATTGVRRVNELLDATKSLRVPVIENIRLQNPDYVLERTMDSLSSESGIVYKPEYLPKFSPFVVYFKLTNPDDWENVVVPSHYIPKSTMAKMAFDDGCVVIKSPKSYSLELVKGVYNRERSRHVCGMKSAIMYEDDVLIFEPGTDCYKSINMSELVQYEPDLNLLDMRCNDIFYICATFGIAAAEQYLYNEIQRVLGEAGIHLNDRHISLIAANMTSSGNILPNRFAGIKLEDSVIMKSSFQEATSTFANAAGVGASDRLQDLSSQILMGVKPKVGTQWVDLVSVVVEKNTDVPQTDSGDFDDFEPEYAPMSPSHKDDVFDDHEYVPASPLSVPESPEEFIEPTFNI